MKQSTGLIFSISLGVFQLSGAVAVPHIPNRAEKKQVPHSATIDIDQFEELALRMRKFGELSFNKVQLYDSCSEEALRNYPRLCDNGEVFPETDAKSYLSATSDPFYGYQVFILIDKSKSARASKDRDVTLAQPQTMYIFVRGQDNQLRPWQTTAALPVSTGKEPAPATSDTREGYFRIQDAERDYVSRKFGEAMPFSLWFESEYGTAIHQTRRDWCDGRIGSRASAGCIRVCPGQMEPIFDLVTGLGSSSPIILLNKRSGIPVASGSHIELESQMDATGDRVISRPKVIRGYPVFVRVVDSGLPGKSGEVDFTLKNPTQGFKRYFRPISIGKLLPGA